MHIATILSAYFAAGATAVALPKADAGAESVAPLSLQARSPWSACDVEDGSGCSQSKEGSYRCSLDGHSIVSFHCTSEQETADLKHL